jgi:iron complex outermembrane receptor protein
LPGVTLTSLSAARGVSFDGVGSDFSDTNFIHQGFDYRQRQVSQELRVVSTSPRRLRYVAGVFYYRERNSVFNFASLVSGFPQFGFQPGYLESADAVVKTDSAAVFGDASLAVADRVTLTAGARYTHEWKHLDYTQANNAGVPGFFAPARSVRDEASYDNVSPRLAVRYNLAPNQAVYASVSRGYKGGGFNTVFVGAQDFRFDDEKAWSYEAGVKAARLDGRLMLNAAVFRFDWTDQQVSIFNGFFSTTTNANRSRSVGGEIEVAAHPSNSVDLSAGVGFADATFVDLKNFVPGEDADGKRQPFASKVTTMLSAQYRFTNWRGPAVRTRADYAYRSSLFFDVANTLAQPGVQLVNVNVALEGRRADLVFFVNNLFDEQYRVTGFLLPSGPLAAPGDPRTFGIGTRVRFR